MRVFITHIATYIKQGDLMTRPSYPSDLTHAEWQLLEPELPALKTGGRPRSVPWARNRERDPVRAAHGVCLAQSAA